MARPKATELTDRELAVMQVFWGRDEATAEDARQELNTTGETLAYVTVANVVRGLVEKGFLESTTNRRPFQYRALRTFDDVSRRLVGDLVDRLFRGSREAMLVNLLDRRQLSDDERCYLKQLLASEESST